MDFLIGAVLALGVGGSATLVGFDRDRAFWPVVMVVIASYYGLFAIMGGGGGVLMHELAWAVAFVAVAVIGFRTSLWWVVAALVAHGVFDLIHPAMIDNPGVPAWWPMMCLGFDVAAGAYLAVRLLRERRAGGAPAKEAPRA